MKILGPSNHIILEDDEEVIICKKNRFTYGYLVEHLEEQIQEAIDEEDAVGITIIEMILEWVAEQGIILAGDDGIGALLEEDGDGK